MPFPPPWSVHHNDDAYWVQDADGDQFGFVYFRPVVVGTSSPAYQTEDEARRLVTNIAKLPALLGKATDISDGNLARRSTGGDDG